MKSTDDRRKLLRLVPFLFLLHAVEAGVMAGPALDAAKTGFPKWFRLVVPPVTVEQFSLALLLSLLIAFALLRWGDPFRPKSWGGYSLVVLQAALLLNVGVILVAVGMLGGYAAGSVTALLVQLPFSLYLFFRAWKGGWLSRNGFLLVIPLSLLLRGPIFFACLFIAAFFLGLMN